MIEIISAKCTGDFNIGTFFNDGNNSLVDFNPFLVNALHPSIRPQKMPLKKL